jgi:hypothetical protein
MSRLEDFRARHAVEIKELYERSGAARWKIPETEWAGAIYRVATSSELLASRSSSANEISCRLVHPDDFAFTLAFRLGCREALENFEARYKVLLHELALEITYDDESRAINLAEVVFRQIYGELEDDGRRRSLFEDFDGRVSLVGWMRAVMEQLDADEPNACAPEVQGQTTCSPLASASCPPRAALAAYRDLVQLNGVPQRGRRLPAKQRDQIRNHLRTCSHCQTLLVAGPENDRHCVELRAAARDQVKRSAKSSLRAMRIAGIVAILAGVAWLAGQLAAQPKQFVSRAVAIVHATVGEARYLVETSSEMLVKAGVGTASRASEARGHPLTEKLSPAESQATSQNGTHPTLPTGIADHNQLPNFELQDTLVADNSNNQDFSSGRVDLTAKDHHWAADKPVSGDQESKPPKRLTPYHLEPDRLYTSDQAKSLIRRFRALGYTADATPVESGDETMYKIEVRQKLHKRRRAGRRG